MNQEELYDAFIECTIEYYSNRDSLTEELVDYYSNQMDKETLGKALVNAILIMEYGPQEWKEKHHAY